MYRYSYLYTVHKSKRHSFNLRGPRSKGFSALISLLSDDSGIECRKEFEVGKTGGGSSTEKCTFHDLSSDIFYE